MQPKERLLRHTGAGAGIGLAVAQALAETGANVAIWYHGNKKALDRAKEIEEEYGVKCDNGGTGCKRSFADKIFCF